MFLQAEKHILSLRPQCTDKLLVILLEGCSRSMDRLQCDHSSWSPLTSPSSGHF